VPGSLFKKISLVNIDIPLPYSSAFEGERISEKDLRVEFGGKKGLALEFLTSKSEDEVEDGKIKIIGPDIEQLGLGGRSLPLAVIVDVYGRKMQKDFEPILERQIHRFVNCAQGLTHTGQRQMNLIRVSHEAYRNGFRLKHIGVILHAMLHQEYGAIVDKVQVRLYTKKEAVKKLLIAAKKVFDQRDERLNGMTDESVDTYYSCLICQSFTPNHVCVITPERIGICGAYSWLDAKASFEVTPTGPNQPILKGKALNKRLGQWKSVNEFVSSKSSKVIEKVSLYSLINFPQSSCGYFECIIAIIPEVNGVMVAHRNYSGLTPSGMDFVALAGLVERGAQTPGFLGASKLYILSKKFISAEGGLKRLVWMPKELKELLGDKLKKAAQDIGEPDLLEQIADEGVANTLEELVSFVKKVKHPTIFMESLI
jgi:acetyl-CoA synthase